jgi:hypothetical protein
MFTWEAFMKNNKQEEGKVIQAQDKFNLSDSPDAYIISVHIQNMMASFGEERTRSIIKELFLTEAPRKTKKKASGE